MEEITEESKSTTKRSNRFRRGLKILIARRNREKKVRTPEPWVRIYERRGIRTLVWGMGDGKTFGSVPLGSDASFGVDKDGVTIYFPNASSAVIGSRQNEEGNILLARKIEKVLQIRNMPSIFLVLVGVAGGLILAALLSGTGGLGLGHFASLSQAIPGSGGGESFSSLSGIPDSMSSGLTCRTH
ncbi:MAG: hypothetical protein ACYCYP_12695 [Leptospirales bacterium]